MTDLCDQPRDGAPPPTGGTEWTASGILARVAALVAERDAGDERRAAERCGVSPDDLARLGAALADDARDEWARAGAVLAAVARGYRVDATWLVTGAEDFHGERLAAASRLRVADLLLRVGERLLTARRAAVPTPSGTVYDSPHDHDPPH